MQASRQPGHNGSSTTEDLLPPVLDLRQQQAEQRRRVLLLGGAGIAVFLILFLTVLAITRPKRPLDVSADPGTQIVMGSPTPAPQAPSLPGTVTPDPAPEDPAPKVTVRAIPVPTPSGPASIAPAGNGPEGSTLPRTVPELGLPPSAPVQPFPTPTPPDPLPGTPGDPPSEPEPSVTAPEPAPVRRSPGRDDGEPSRRVPQDEPSGGLRVYFDADSSTFDRRERRLPLRVEIYVNGRRVLESDDPEKREFNLGRLPAGEHEIRIVPFVGDASSDARTERIVIEPGRPNRFGAVLHRSAGVASVRKFRERD